jgi:carboxymethylenebutenolidase
MGEMLSFPSNGASSSGYLARAREEPGREGGVVVIQEWWGLNQHVKNVVDRFAAAGFFALAPDLYHGTVTASPDEAGKLLMALDITQAEQDLRGSIRHLKAITGKPVGSVGFCMGGALSLYAACTNGADVGACVVYYGGHPKVAFPWEGLRAPVLGHWAEDDAFANATAANIEAELRKRDHPFEFHHYPGTRHAFFNDDRPAVYDRPAAEQSWERTLAFLRAHL